MANLVGGIDADGARPIEFADLQNLADEWRTSPFVPDGVASLLSTSRALFTHSWFVYEFMAVAVAWSLMAVEAALRSALAPVSNGTSLKNLILRAEREGLVTPAWTERLHAARQLRNRFAHPETQPAFTVGMAAPLLETAHEVCCQLAAGPPAASA
jgi:hypothetical protein